MVRIDGKGGSLFGSREQAERELRSWGFYPSMLLGADFERLLFTGKECKVMTARIEEAA